MNGYKILIQITACLQYKTLTINDISGTPLISKKIVKKNGKCNQYVLPKSSWTTFKTIFKTLSALLACHVTIIRGVIYTKSMIFEVLW